MLKNFLKAEIEFTLKARLCRNENDKIESIIIVQTTCATKEKNISMHSEKVKSIG